MEDSIGLSKRFGGGNRGPEAARKQRSDALEKLRDMDRFRETRRTNLAELMFSKKNASYNDVTAKSSSGIFSFLQVNRTKDEKMKAEMSKLEAKRFKLHMEAMKKLNKSVNSLENLLKLSALSNFLGGPGIIGGGNRRGGGSRGSRRFRHPKTGRFISAAQARRLGIAGAGAGLLGGGLAKAGGIAAAGVGAYFSTQAIRNNQGRDFFEGGLNSRAGGYAGNIGSGALAGASIAGPIGALVGAGIGLVGSLYADYKEEIDAFILDMWKGTKRLISKGFKMLGGAFSSIGNFFTKTLPRGMRTFLNTIPGFTAVSKWISDNNVIGKSWDAAKYFFGTTLPMVGEAVISAIPGGEVALSWAREQAVPWVHKQWESVKRQVSGFISSVWAFTVKNLPFSADSGEKLLRDLKRTPETAMRNGLLNNSGVQDLYIARDKAQTRMLEEQAKERGNMATMNDRAAQRNREAAQEYQSIIEMLDTQIQRRTTFGYEGFPAPQTGTNQIPITPATTTGQIFIGGQQAMSQEEISIAQAYTRASAVAQYRKEAADRTGVDFGYLMTLAARESSFDPNERPLDSNGNPISSAAGLDQFIDSTWNEMVARYGDRYGLTRGGRTDPRQSSIAAALFTKENSDHLRRTLGRPPTSTELYLAHFMGRTGATRFLENHARNPNGFAASVMASAANSNPWVFYHGGDKSRPRTYQEILNYMAEGRSATASRAAVAGFSAAQSQAFSEVYNPSGSAPSTGTAVASSARRPSNINSATSSTSRRPEDVNPSAVPSTVQAAMMDRPTVTVPAAQAVMKNIPVAREATYRPGDIPFVQQSDYGLVVLNIAV